MSRTLTGQLLKPVIGHSGRIRERLEGMRQPLLWRKCMEVLSYPSVWIQLYTSAEFKSLESLGTEPFLVILLSIPMVVNRWNFEQYHDYFGTYRYLCKAWHFIFNCASYAFQHSDKYLLISLCTHQNCYVGIKSCEYEMYLRCSS
jgi:hypothetical protein